jgi:2-polyprenyl-3-methyl-5-hydroxy-6-metoxy-1,4-benzoquinol methylase
VTHPADSPVLCPICDQAAKFLRNLEFSRRGKLPTQIGIHVCKSCSFGFSFPRTKEPYDKYYGAYQNDQLGENWQISESERKRYRDQISVLNKYLYEGSRLRVLDFGCGQGGLLETLALQHKLHSFYGCDANAHTRITDAGVSIHSDLHDLVGPFDVIVLSHVVEHLIDFEILGQVSKLLSRTGIVYIEVPNAGAYECYPRREFLYYFDRLHVNHFTKFGLHKIADAFSLAPLEFGDKVFGYKDDGPFPAIYGVFQRGAEPKVRTIPEDLNASFCRYVEAENTRLTPTRARLRRGREVIAYGFGDNFFRQFGKGGPLEDIPLVAVVDQRSSELSSGEYASRYEFLDSLAASARFPLATWVVTVSWGGEAIAEKLKSLGIQSSRIYLL